LIGELIMVGVILSLPAGAVAADLFKPEARVRRKLKRARPTPIKEIKDGTVPKIVGTMLPVGQPLISPVSGRRCAYYFTVVEMNGVEVIRESRWQDFAVDDGTGKALVRIDKAMVLVRYNFHTLDAPTPEVEAFLRRHDRVLNKGKYGYMSELRFTEGVVEMGKEVTLVGHAMLEPDPTPDAARVDYRHVPLRVVVQASDRMPLFLTDDLTVVT
jgi:hypothetical protein